MKTVHEISELTGLSIRTLQYYDKIGLLKPAAYTDSGYRLYGESELETLQEIMLFRELEFPLKDIKRILQSPDYDRYKALEQQIGLLRLKKEHIDKLIVLAEKNLKGGKTMDFRAFDKKKMEEYAAEARKTWGDTPEYSEYTLKAADRTEKEQTELADEMMDIFRRFGLIKDMDPASADAAALVKELQDHITKNYYKCTDKILLGLGEMYQAGGKFTENIDEAGGEGTAAFVNKAIKACLA